VTCAYCNKLIDEDMGACEDCAHEHGVCAKCGESLERRFRDDYSRKPYCLEHA